MTSRRSRADRIAVALTLVVNFVAAIVVSRRERLDRTQTTNLATTILARGEFSLIIAALGAEAGLDPRVVPFVAGYVLVLALGAPILAAQSATRRSLRAPAPRAGRDLVVRGGRAPHRLAVVAGSATTAFR